jgi:serine/threonine-protein kinase
MQPRGDRAQGTALVVPGYDVWGLLGEGGMSQVWLAKHPVLAVPVIVKTLRRELASGDGSGGAAGRILSEARLMARVASPLIVRAIDAGQLPGGGTPYLVQEYVDGLDLAELDRRRRAALGVGLPLWMVCDVMRDVCSALRAAHSAGVIHRDLKPSNVFGAPEAGIRLGDFGIAVARSDRVHDAAGTLKFMAPEQLAGLEIDRTADVWGAAATACDLRYGHAPFASIQEIQDASAPPRLPPPTTPAEAYFQQLLRGMLARDPAARPSDTTEPIHHFAMLARAIRPPPLAATKRSDHQLSLSGVELDFVVGDIAEAHATAIVSSANFELKMRSGVGEALVRRGGVEIEEQAMAGGEQPLGSCIRTRAGRLDASHVFHAVGAWNEVSCVGRAFSRALLLAEEHRVTTLAVPALGTGIARVGLEASANAMLRALRWHLELGGTCLRRITVYLDSAAKLRAVLDVAREVFRTRDVKSDLPQDLGLPVSVPSTALAGTTPSYGADVSGDDPTALA